MLKLGIAGDWVTFRTKDNSFVSLVRSGITPISYRKFDSSTNQWFVWKTQVPKLLSLAKKFFPEVDTSQVPESWLTVQQDKSDAYSKLFLTKEAPAELVKLVYESLVLRYHPDSNDGTGDATRLQEVLAAYRELRKVLK